MPVHGQLKTATYEGTRVNGNATKKTIQVTIILDRTVNVEERASIKTTY